MTTRTRITATPLYSGSFMPEEGTPVLLADSSPGTALAALDKDQAWFAIEVVTSVEERWTNSRGAERWQGTGDRTSYRIYAGEALTAEDVTDLPGDHSILLCNMRNNGWGRVVRTRRGNFQPLNEEDVVISA